MIDTTKCRFCKESDPTKLHKHSRSKPRKDGTRLQYLCCRLCSRDQARRLRQTESGKESVARSVKKYEKANRERKLAWKKCAVLERLACVVCGNPESDRHHPDITKPLYIIYLCRVHHKQAHKAMKVC